MRSLSILLGIVLLAQSAFASPLIFKTTKELTSGETFVELGNLDTSKYSRVRIQIVNTHDKVATRSDFREFVVRLNAIEGTDELTLLTLEASIRFSTVLDTPPARLSIAVKGNGTFKVFVWAS